MSAQPYAIDLELGRHAGIPMEKYHSMPGISSSGLKHINRSPAHYKAYMNGPREVTPAMKLGTATHMAVLEPDAFASAYVEEPNGLRGKNNSRTKNLTTWEAKLPAGVESLSQMDARRIANMAAAVHAHPWASKLLRSGVAEESVWWEDKETGLLCKCRPDYWRVSARVVIDLKTTGDARPREFQRTAINQGYDLSAAFYLDGTDAEDFLWLVVERDPPHGVMVYTAAPFLERGRRLYMEALSKLRTCHDTGEWPCYSTEIEELEMPRWAQ